MSGCERVQHFRERVSRFVQHRKWLITVLLLLLTFGTLPSISDAVADEPDSRFWAYRPLQKPEFPKVKRKHWPLAGIDWFILEKLESNGIEPSEYPPQAQLIRRLYFDLIGLPPTPEQLKAFLDHARGEGFELAWFKAVDDLLESPQFGERWGRHWLDVARFAESSGKETNVSFPHAWRYRKYVIDSFAADKPFDQFIREQLAGDLLPARDEKHRADLLVATGFLAIGPKGLNEMNPLQYRADVIDEQIDAVGRAVMATSLACARCHDHKSDPLSMEDYYAVAGIFASSRTFIGTSIAPGNSVGGDLIVLPGFEGQVIPNRSFGAKKTADLRAELQALKDERDDRQKKAKEALARGENPGKYFTLMDALRILWRSGGIEGKLETVDDKGNALPLAMGVMDADEIRDIPVLDRGEITEPGVVVARRFPDAIQVAEPPAIGAHQSGRLELASWLTRKDHPLTARVYVNRVWRHLFGQGLVRTVDNFGANGETPSHPELLDFLAVEFMEDNWSTKKLIRSIVISNTYWQGSQYRRAAFRADPDNRLLWRISKRRLEAEVIRDAMLQVSGRLKLEQPESSLIAQVGDRPISIISFDKRIAPDLDGSRHRSVYLPILRDRLPDVLDLFDCAEPSLVTGNRETTNVPLQALFLMNSQFVREQAEGLAQRVSADGKTQEDEVALAYRHCFSREPDEIEMRLALEFLNSASTEDSAATKSRDESQAGPSNPMVDYCQALLATSEFRNVD